MDQWVISLLVQILIAVIAASGAWLTTFITMRARAREEKAALEKHQKESQAALKEQHRLSEQNLIDQLQEERAVLVTQITEERRANEQRLDILWADKSASRAYVGALENHIWARREPPPPEKPAGYIP